MTAVKKEVVMVRMDPAMHADLFERAQKLGCSMNQLCIALLGQPLQKETPLKTRRVRSAARPETDSGR